VHRESLLYTLALAKAAGLAQVIPDALEFGAHLAQQAKGKGKNVMDVVKHEFSGRQTMEDLRAAHSAIKSQGAVGAAKQYLGGVKQTFANPGKDKLMSGIAYGAGVPIALHEAHKATKDPNAGPGERAGHALGELGALATYHPGIGAVTSGLAAIGSGIAGKHIGRMVDRVRGKRPIQVPEKQAGYRRLIRALRTMKVADFDGMMGADEGLMGGGPADGVDVTESHMYGNREHPAHPGKSCADFENGGRFPGANPKEERGDTPEAEGIEQRESAHNANLR
jgi:hypothetical protein